MHISFLGPIGCVTGSCYWLRHHPEGGRALQFLVDCGARQGEHDNDAWNRAPLPFDAAAIDFVLLTHAHLDHCGLLPRLVQDGFRGEVYCTDATREIALVILHDGARMEDASYTTDDVMALRFHSIDAGQLGSCCRVQGDVFVQAYSSAHIYGSVSVRVLWGPRDSQRSITFSGDLGPNAESGAPMPLHGARHVPLPSDYVLVESTYGGRERTADESNDSKRLQRLLAEIQPTLSDPSGVVLIPCFAVDRLQAVLFDLYRLWWRDPACLKGARVFVHSKMASEVNQIYARHLGAVTTRSKGATELAWLSEDALSEVSKLARPRLDRQDALMALAAVFDHQRPAHVELPRLHTVAWHTEDVMNTTGPKIVLTTAGMCSGGPIVRYLPTYLKRPNARVLLTGYQSGGTLGAELQALGTPQERATALEEDPHRTLTIPRHASIPLGEVRATVARLTGYSAHADQRGLVSWLLGERGQHGAAKRVIFLTHGDNAARHHLREAIERGAKTRGAHPLVETPAHPGEVYDLDAGRWVDALSVGRAELQALVARVARLEQRLMQATP
jgi:metallo-beta-lactamase family protein